MDQERTKPVKMLITTSRNPTPLLRQANKILVFSLPNTLRVNRGSLGLKHLFSYCWNMKIPRLLILQNTINTEILEIRAYFIDKKVQLSEIIIELSDLISLKKHNKPTRIQIDAINIIFENNVEKSMKMIILTLFKPILRKNAIKQSNKILKFNFRSENSTSIIGTAIQQNNNEELPLYTLKIMKKISSDF